MPMNRTVFMLLAAAAVAAVAGAQSTASAPASYVGSETCLGCHEDAAKGLGPHDSQGFAKLSSHGCESCHGPGSFTPTTRTSRPIGRR